QKVVAYGRVPEPVGPPLHRFLVSEDRREVLRPIRDPARFVAARVVVLQDVHEALAAVDVDVPAVAVVGAPPRGAIRQIHPCGDEPTELADRDLVLVEPELAHLRVGGLLADGLVPVPFSELDEDRLGDASTRVVVAAVVDGARTRRAVVHPYVLVVAY